MNEKTKKALYFLIVLAAALPTIYLIATTIRLNMISATKGPVHWHADFEIWVCGEEIKLAEPKGWLSNKQGTNLLHSHDDKRIHAEGVLIDKSSASLGAFFNAAGGHLSSDALKIPTDNGMVSIHDGDNCNAQAGRLYVFVNGNLITSPSNYVISPYEKVPPGDRIKIIFTEESIEDVNLYIRGESHSTQ